MSLANHQAELRFLQDQVRAELILLFGTAPLEDQGVGAMLEGYLASLPHEPLPADPSQDDPSPDEPSAVEPSPDESSPVASFLSYLQANPLLLEQAQAFGPLGFEPNAGSRGWQPIANAIRDWLKVKRGTRHNQAVISQLSKLPAAAATPQAIENLASLLCHLSTGDWKEIEHHLALCEGYLNADSNIQEQAAAMLDFFTDAPAELRTYWAMTGPSWTHGWNRFKHSLLALIGRWPPETALSLVPAGGRRSGCWANMHKWQAQCETDAQALDRAREEIGQPFQDAKSMADALEKRGREVTVPAAPAPVKETAEADMEKLRARLGEEVKQLDDLRERGYAILSEIN